MTQRISQRELDAMIGQLTKMTGLPIVTNNCYGYFQLGIKRGENGGMSSLYSTNGCSKRELYWQIKLVLDILYELKNPRQLDRANIHS